MTPKQKRCLDFIRDYIVAHDIAPSYEEIAAGVGAAGRGSVYEPICELVKAGALIRTHGHGRNLSLPDSQAEACRDKLVEVHGFNDGDGMTIVCTPTEALATLRRVLG